MSQQQVLIKKKKAKVAGGTFDPEAGLTLTNSFPPGALSAGDFDRGSSCVFACELSVPANPVGLIFELGGAATGACVAFRSGHSFVIRGGNGGANAPVTSIDDAAVLYIPAGNNEPTGVGTLAWEFNVGLAKVRAWWNGLFLGEATALGGSFRSNLFAGADNGAYDFDGQGGSICAGEPTTGLGASTSDLRYYENQTVT